MSAQTWVFGYGSLVSSASMATTIGRPVPDADIVVAHLDGYGRRWNYGSLHLRGDWRHDRTSVTQGRIDAKIVSDRLTLIRECLADLRALSP